MTTKETSRPLLGASAAARRLGVTTQCVSNWAKSGRLPVALVTESGMRLYAPDEVARLRKARQAAGK